MKIIFFYFEYLEKQGNKERVKLVKLWLFEDFGFFRNLHNVENKERYFFKLQKYKNNFALKK